MKTTIFTQNHNHIDDKYIGKNQEQAIYWHRKAAYGGNSDSRELIMDLFKDNKIVVSLEEIAAYRKDVDTEINKLEKEYFEDFLRLANGKNTKRFRGYGWNQDHPAYHLAELYEKGSGTETNITEAIRWYKISNDRENQRASITLGIMYYNGNGVAKDRIEARKWFLIAAEKHDNTQAAMALSRMYFYGIGARKDIIEAEKWMLKAAKSKDPDYLHEIGELYFGQKNNNGEDDYTLAYAWMNLASAVGNTNSTGLLNAMESMMTSYQIREAHKKSRSLSGIIE